MGDPCDKIERNYGLMNIYIPTNEALRLAIISVANAVSPLPKKESGAKLYQ